MKKNSNKRTTEWVNLLSHKDLYEPIRGYSVRYQQPEIDRERARQEAAEAAESAEAYLVDRSVKAGPIPS
jgi:hypothetical protein